MKKKPKIVISRNDHARLLQIANGMVDRNPELADELLAELERARIVEPGRAPADSVQMGATLDYSADDGTSRQVTLVYPAEADIAQGRVSVLTPIGVALLGLSVGQSIDWTANDGREHRLTVQAVRQATVAA